MKLFIILIVTLGYIHSRIVIPGIENFRSLHSKIKQECDLEAAKYQQSVNTVINGGLTYIVSKINEEPEKSGCYLDSTFHLFKLKQFTNNVQKLCVDDRYEALDHTTIKLEQKLDESLYRRTMIAQQLDIYLNKTDLQSLLQRVSMYAKVMKDASLACLHRQREGTGQTFESIKKKYNKCETSAGDEADIDFPNFDMNTVEMFGVDMSMTPVDI